MIQKQTLPHEQATYALGKKLAKHIAIGDVITLSGGLGSGKTCLARGIIQTLLTTPQAVPSPSFTLIQSYDTTPPIWHVDLYRLDAIRDISELGILEAIEYAALVIEWPEKIIAYLPDNRLDILLEPICDFSQRRATLTAIGALWKDHLDELDAS